MEQIVSDEKINKPALQLVRRDLDNKKKRFYFGHESWGDAVVYCGDYEKWLDDNDDIEYDMKPKSPADAEIVNIFYAIDDSLETLNSSDAGFSIGHAGQRPKNLALSIVEDTLMAEADIVKEPVANILRDMIISKLNLPFLLWSESVYRILGMYKVFLKKPEQHNLFNHLASSSTFERT